MSVTEFVTLEGETLHSTRIVDFVPRVGERIAFPPGEHPSLRVDVRTDWYKVTAVYHDLGNGMRTVIVEKM